jgi:hypothetical protein
LRITDLLAKAVGRPPREPFSRSAVNRAYYASFGEATDYAARVGYVPVPGAGSHDKVWRHIGAYSDGNTTRDAARKAGAGQGLFLKDRRRKADYERGSRLAASDATDAVKEAARIVQTIDGL